jgi:hypothetical protein
MLDWHQLEEPEEQVDLEGNLMLGISAWYFCIASQLVTWNLMLVAQCYERKNDR